MFFPFQRQMISGLGLLTATDAFKLLSSRPLEVSDGLMILMMYTVTHVMQMAGGLVQQSSPGVPLGV